jgi:hypothetical protein
MLSTIFALLRGAVPLVGGFFTGGTSLVWSFLQGLWGTEIGRITIIGLGALLGGYVWGFSHEHAVKIAAVEEASKARDAEWSKEIASANAKNEQRIQEALSAASKVSPTPAAPSDLAKLCAADAACRGALSPKRRVSASSRVLDSKRQQTDH